MDEDRLTDELAALEKGIREAHGALASGLQRVITGPIRQTFGAAAAAHRQILEEASFPPALESEIGAEEELPGEAVGDHPSGGLRVRASVYRARVQSEVLEPLRDALLDRNDAGDLEAELGAFKRSLIRLAASLPEELSRREPQDLYLPREGEPLRNRLGKGIVRFRRRVGSWRWKATQLVGRLGGKAPLEMPAHSQTVPLRALVERSFEGPFTLAMESFREPLHQHFAKFLGELETAVARWTREWHPLEGKIREGGGLVPPSVKMALAPRFARISGGDDLNVGDPPGLEPPAHAQGPSHLLPSHVAGVLSRALKAGEEMGEPSEILQALEGSLEQEWSNLLGRVEVSGSFMPSVPPARISKRALRLERKGTERTHAWALWHRSVPGRISLAFHLCRLRADLELAGEQLVRSVAEKSLFPLLEMWEESSRVLLELEESGTEAFSVSSPTSNLETLAEKVGGLLAEGLKVLEEALVVPLGGGDAENQIRALADEFSTGLARTLSNLPASLSVRALQAGGHFVNPLGDQRDIPFQEVGRQVLDVLRLEALRNGADPLLAVLATAREAVEELPKVLQFNLEAASAELAQASSDSAEAVLEEAGSLTREGLSRTEEAANRLFQGMPEAWSAFVTTTELLLNSAFTEVHGRTSKEGGVPDHLVGLGAKLRLWGLTGADRLRSSVAQGSVGARRILNQAGDRILGMVRLGRTAVGATPSEQGEGERDLEVISRAPELLAALPLVYRRLFSFQPLSDGELLKGRAEEISWVRRRIESWEGGMGTPTLITGPVGTGHTSFFNVLAVSLSGEAEIHRLELTERIRGEEALASRLAALFEFSDNEPWSFDRLARRLLRSPKLDRPRIVFTERLEHLLLRTPGGTDLIENFISFQAQTSQKVFWLSSMAGVSWKRLAKSEPRLVALITTRPLSPPSRETLEELILARHRRSGLALEFRAPSDLNPLLRRRLRLARGEKARQAILQTEFFDRLHRFSGENIPMAILNWLRSTDFRATDGKLLITPSTPVRFAFLNDLDIELDFALKAILEHGSLTLEEYREIFGAPREDSFQIFEGLRARMLVEPSGARRGGIPTSRGTVEEGERYRIPSLLSEVVAQHLKMRNILH